jgi:hypothetical protein
MPPPSHPTNRTSHPPTLKEWWVAYSCKAGIALLFTLPNLLSRNVMNDWLTALGLLVLGGPFFFSGCFDWSLSYK